MLSEFRCALIRRLLVLTPPLLALLPMLLLSCRPPPIRDDYLAGIILSKTASLCLASPILNVPRRLSLLLGENGAHADACWSMKKFSSLARSIASTT